jgi:hypothetical protein
MEENDIHKQGKEQIQSKFTLAADLHGRILDEERSDRLPHSPWIVFWLLICTYREHRQRILNSVGYEEQ